MEYNWQNSGLPAAAALPSILDALRCSGSAVLTAAPGAGKTTLAPIALSEFPGRIVMLEPRRVAARSAARRVSALLNAPVGTVCGYAVRGETRQNRDTRILIVTGGVFLRMLADDPALEGVGTVIFDEFHERSLDSDLALALTLDSRRTLRDDLKILVMSATLDPAPVAALLGGAPVIDAPGRMFPVELRWADQLPEPNRRTAAVVRCIRRALREAKGDMLVFLPGTGEIAACYEMLEEEGLPPECDLRCLHGSLDAAAQDAALAPAAPGTRRILLSTNVAESSLTVPGIRIVVDCGYEKRLRFDPAAGISFLETVRISKSSAEQRSGRAGRTAPGTVYRLWNEREHAALPDRAKPEILQADLTPLVLAAADWGTAVDELRWIDPPPAAPLAAARTLLKQLGALLPDGRPTPTGRTLARLPVHPRFGRMLLMAEGLDLLPLAAELAAVLEERDICRFSAAADLRERIRLMRNAPGRFRTQCAIRDRLLGEFRRKMRHCDVERCGLLTAFAFPEWIAENRTRHGTRFLLASGGGAALAEADDLRGAEFLAVARLGGGERKDAVIRLAAPLTEAELFEHFSDRIVTELQLEFDRTVRRVTARRVSRLDALVLRSVPEEPPEDEAARLLLKAASDAGCELPPPEAKNAAALLTRLRFAAARDPELFGNWSAAAFRERLPELAAPHLAGVRTLRELEKLDWNAILRGAVGFETLRELDRLYPETFVTPLGSRLAIDYSQQHPTLPIRIQELYGVRIHPAVGRNRIPLRLELLSPARRPVQITLDLPGFWSGGWPSVRKEMRSRYPKHFWPDDPASAQPTAGTRKKSDS